MTGDMLLKCVKPQQMNRKLDDGNGTEKISSADHGR